MRKVYVKTLGCKVNTFDSQALESQFKKSGYSIVTECQDADITVLNTCSVTAVAEKEARYLLRRYRRDNPDSFQVVTGCYAQINSTTISSMDEVDFVVPNEVKERLVPLVEQRLNSSEMNGHAKFPSGIKMVSENRQSHFKSSVTLFDRPLTERTRAFLKIQDGCNGFCSYCQIPYARGASRSVEPYDVLSQARDLVKSGVKEIVLTGIHIGDYGDDPNKFLNLLRQLFEIEDLQRLRISSLEPSELSEQLLEVLFQYKEKFCDHFHLPLQSGDDRILKLMNRQYDSKTYYESLEMIRSFFPNAQISADVIPGFPGEGENEFLHTIEFIKKCQLASLHVFPYSKRPNTAALRLPNHLDPSVIKERSQLLRKLSRELYHNFCSGFFAQEAEVLWENFDQKTGRWIGKSKNYMNVLSTLNFKGEIGKIDKIVLKGFVEEGKILGVRTT